MFSDGVSEAMSADGEEYGEERILQPSQKHTGVEPAATCCRRIFADVRAFTKGAAAERRHHRAGAEIRRLVAGRTARTRPRSAAGIVEIGSWDASMSRIEKRLLILWFALAFVVWNGVYDMRMHDTMRGYLLEAALAQAGLGAASTCAPSSIAALVDAVAFSTAWALGVFLAGSSRCGPTVATSPNGANQLDRRHLSTSSTLSTSARAP